MFARRLAILAGTLTVALGLTACGIGHKEAHPRVADENNNGGYVDAGPITYQLQISRVLNPYATEDSQYVKGLPAGTTGPTATQEWYGVFLWAKNQTSEPQTTTTADKFVITDTQGATYHPVALSPSTNPYAWTSQRLPPLGIEPAPDTTASFGPTQGELLLYKIGTSAYANRPLTLHILGSGNQTLASISLDL